MPHAVENEEERLISLVVAGSTAGLPGDLFQADREADAGEKAEDAEDYEDIGSDDLGDLAEDYDDKTNNGAALDVQEQTNGHGEEDDDRDLFGDDPFGDLFQGGAQSPESTGDNDAQISGEETSFKTEADGSSALGDASFDHSRNDAIKKQSEEPGIEEDQDPDVLEQQRLFAEARAEREDRQRRGAENVSGLPPALQTDDEVFYTVWPQFEPHKPPKFGQLLPGRRAYYLSRKPLKPPRPVHPTKISLELSQDQEKLFRLPAPPATVDLALKIAEAEARGLVLAATEEVAGSSDEDDVDEMQLDDSDSEEVAGLRWDDIVAACHDWTLPNDDTTSDTAYTSGDDDVLMNGAHSDEEFDILAPKSKKKKKTVRYEIPLMRSSRFPGAILDDPEKSTARLAKKVKIDLNDPHMLVDLQDPAAVQPQKRRNAGNLQRDTTGGMARDLSRRYNISNDEAYDLLKENHQNKVRSNLANVALEHALPAVKLQYPFFKVKLSPKEARAFHRPALSLAFAGRVDFEKLHFKKRKHLKGKETHEIFSTSHDLSVADNSNVVLLEYSEEYPNILSNFGMSNKLLNYYRRRNEQDNSRPKFDIGETSTLLPQDKSPFAIFGDVKPGEMVPTIHNGMYRAPVFRHDPKATDFLLISNRTGVDGRRWYLRNMENLHVVGQQFPVVEVPGTHSRKVTDAAKRRLRMMSYRMFKRHKRLKNEMILKHLPGSDVAQNRSKMREFMDYDKDRGWLPRKSEAAPDEATIRSWIKPEDLCLLEAMQVGDRQLQDAGYTKDAEGEDIDEDDEKGTQSLDQQLAPWQTSKNFLMACQGKAFVAVHGEGDPTGRGEGYNLVRTSMKGGYREVGESIEDRLDAKRQKELGGHQYNVARQHKAYTEALLRVWEAQKRSLSLTIENDDADMGGIEDAGPNRLRSPSVANGRPLKADDVRTTVTSATNASQVERILRVTRKGVDKYGNPFTNQELIRDPTVIREYKRRRNEKLVNSMSLEQLKKTGDPDLDELIMKKLREERDRIKRNQERRYARNKAKGLPLDAGSPGADAASPEPDGEDDGENPGTPAAVTKRKTNPGGTQRKCANCGQVGHIKTNKKLCPMLNGTIKTGDGFGDSAFGSAPTPSQTQQPPASSPAAGFG